MGNEALIQVRPDIFNFFFYFFLFLNESFFAVQTLPHLPLPSPIPSRC